MLGAYHEVVAPFLARGHYPGSPLVAAAVLRAHDHLHLCELHPTDYELLRHLTSRDRRIRTEQADGFQRATVLLPPVQKRAVVLIDPPYEIKDDYRVVSRTLFAMHDRMPGAQVMLWYPVVERSEVTRLVAALRHGPLRDVWQVELGLRPDAPGHGMTASGLILVNPPWTLPGELEAILPLLRQALAPTDGFWRVERLIAE